MCKLIKWFHSWVSSVSTAVRSWVKFTVGVSRSTNRGMGAEWSSVGQQSICRLNKQFDAGNAAGKCDDT